jgi:5-(carboxyamino)imidazole ribonucleotide synthase
VKVGILGAGQLGRMLALAGYPLGLQFRFLDPAAGSPAGQMAEHQVGDYLDPAARQRFAEGLDLITYEFENVPVEAAEAFQKLGVSVYPPSSALETAQDRLIEKSAFRDLGIPVPGFAAVNSREELEKHAAEFGFPCVLKTRRMGYDGKGQVVLRNPSDLDTAWNALGGSPLILEEFIPFQRELSILSVRGRNGETAFYPLVENHHREGILRLSLAPAPGITPNLQARAESYAQKMLDKLDYVGVLAIELFERDNEFIVNEMAPRVHNSGHWTIEGAETSQFENHLRAVCGMPLGAPKLVGCSAMVNLIGTLPDREAVLAIPGAHLHLYGKEPRHGRKIGHITVRADEESLLQERLRQVQSLVS